MHIEHEDLVGIAIAQQHPVIWRDEDAMRVSELVCTPGSSVRTVRIEDDHGRIRLLENIHPIV